MPPSAHLGMAATLSGTSSHSADRTGPSADAIDNPYSFDRVPTYWLPTIRSLGVNVPVILIGNK